MIVTVDLHLRSNTLDDHRHLGAVGVELSGTLPTPHQEMACCVQGRRVRAWISSVHGRGSHLPRVFADELTAGELVL